MQISEVVERDTALLDNLTTIWEGSVVTTHLFLTPTEIQTIKKFVPGALQTVPHLLVVESTEGVPLGFMGVAKQKIEMLFVAADQRGLGLGKALVAKGREEFAINEVTVNEQNPSARQFYEHLSFQVQRRQELDEQGQAYPILLLKLVE